MHTTAVTKPSLTPRSTQNMPRGLQILKGTLSIPNPFVFLSPSFPTKDRPPRAFPGPTRRLWRRRVTCHSQLHDKVVVGGALIDVLQRHDVLVLDPGDKYESL